MKALECASCGVKIYLPEEIIARRREDGQTFFCMNGHANVFRPSEVDKLKDRVKTLEDTVAWYRERLKAYRDDLTSVSARMAGYKGQMKKLQKRVAVLEKVIG